jgi:hypothetical protein
MKERPTPETDAFFRSFADGDAAPSHAEYYDRMTQLERERDEAREQWRLSSVCRIFREQRDNLAEALDLCLARLEHHTEFGALVQSDMSAMHSARQALAIIKAEKP